MLIKTIKVGSLQTNCYIITDEATKEAAVIDPGDEANLILPEIEGLKVKAIFLTHGHPDHFGAVDELKILTKAPLYMNWDDGWFLEPDAQLNESQEIKIGSLTFKVIATPGHSLGGVCLLVEDCLFSGDTLFFGTWGRTDLPGGSEAAMQKSLRRLGTLPPATRVFPGHGRPTTIQQEKEQGTIGQ